MGSQNWVTLIKSPSCSNNWRLCTPPNSKFSLQFCTLVVAKNNNGRMEEDILKFTRIYDSACWSFAFDLCVLQEPMVSRFVPTFLRRKIAPWPDRSANKNNTRISVSGDEIIKNSSFRHCKAWAGKCFNVSIMLCLKKNMQEINVQPSKKCQKLP